MSDSSGASAPPHHGHQWVVLVFNLLPFFGGQFNPLFHVAMAAALKAYTSGSNGPKQLAQGLLVTEADLAAGLLHGHLLAYCRRRWLLTAFPFRYETDGEVAKRVFDAVLNVATPLRFIWNSGTWKSCSSVALVHTYINYLVKQSIYPWFKMSHWSRPLNQHPLACLFGVQSVAAIEAHKGGR